MSDTPTPDKTPVEVEESFAEAMGRARKISTNGYGKSDTGEAVPAEPEAAEDGS